MEKRNYLKALLASVVMFGSVSAVVTAEEKQVTYETILGDAYDYGITAASFHQGNHMQSNFAAKDFSGNNVIEADLSGEGHVPIIAGTIADGSVLRFGNHTANDQAMTYDVTTSSADRVTTDNPQKGQLNIVSKTADEIANTVNGMIDHFIASSESLKNHAPTITLSDDWWEHFDQNNAVIDLTSYGDNETVYINVPETAYNFRNALNCSNGLHIMKNSGTTVVFNIPDESISFNKFRVSVNGQEYNTEPSTAEGTINQNMDNEIIRKIYFNCYSAKTVGLANTAGLFLVPRSDATVTVNGTSSGWIATAGYVTNPSGEWHFAFHARSIESTNPGETPVVPEPEPEPTPVQYDVHISKVDATNSAEIAGAVLIVTDEEHNVIEQWTSEADTTHTITLTEGTYTLTEITAPDGYEVAESIVFEVGADGLIKANGQTVDKIIMKDEPTPVTPEPEPEKVSVTVTKVWNDADDQDGKRPDDITVILTANGVEQSVQKTLTAETGWTAQFDDLDKTDSEGNKIAYSVKEVSVNDYDTNIQGSDESGITIINTHSPETRDISVQANFDENIPEKPDEIDIDLLGNDKPIDSKPLTEDNDYSNTFEDVPVYEEGEPVSFRMTIGNPIPRFSPKIEGNIDDGFNIIMDYDYPQTGKLIITKTVEGPVTQEEAEGALKFEVYSTDIGDSWEYMLSDFAYDETSKQYKLELDLPVGNYEVVESVTSIDGYELARVSYSVNNAAEVEAPSASVIVEADKEITVAYRDEYEYETHPVIFSKTDPVGNDIGGARLVIVDENQQTVALWNTVTGTSHTEMLRPGIYELQERIVPDGYKLAMPIVFAVDADGTVKVHNHVVDKVIMVDELEDNIPDLPDEPEPDYDSGRIRIVKVIEGDVAKEQYIDKVNFEVYDTENGNSFECPLSSFNYDPDTGHYYNSFVIKPSNYDVFELPEEIEGYDLTVSCSIDNGTAVETNHAELILEKDAITTITFTNTYTKQNEEPVIPDEPVAEKHNVVISKQDVTGKEIAGAELTVTRDGEELDRWISVEDESHTIELVAGEYTLTEVLAPEGYKIANTIVFTLDEYGNIFVNDEQVNKIVMVDEYETPEEDKPDQPDTDPTPDDKEETPSESHTQIPAKPSPDTSDKTNLLMHTSVLSTACLVVIGMILFRHRH